ncbi:MAG: 4Fe-4S binding protein [Bacteroidaceae bacterium]
MKNFKQRMIDKKVEQELSIKEGIVTVDEVSCDGCGVCVDTCPFSAIEIRVLNDKEVKGLPFKGRLKVLIKGRNKAFINQDLCRACGLCMKKCHEFAIHKAH